jgi:hypothetical protein
MVAIRYFPGIAGSWKAWGSPCQGPWEHDERTRSADTLFECVTGARRSKPGQFHQVRTYLKIQSSLVELRPTSKAAANIKPEEYSGYFEDLI